MFIRTHTIGNRSDIEPGNSLFAHQSVHFQPGYFTGRGSERVKVLEAALQLYLFPASACASASEFFQFSSRYGIDALGKAHMLSTTSLRNVPEVAFETVPVYV